MKKVELFYLTYCPHCRKAFRLLEELRAKNPKYKDVVITEINEADNKAYSDSLDYYYVPTFYVDGVKVHEGVIEESDVIRVLDSALS